MFKTGGGGWTGVQTFTIGKFWTEQSTSKDFNCSISMKYESRRTREGDDRPNRQITILPTVNQA